LSTIANEFPDARVVESKENLGFGAASNLGANYASGQYLLFLNPDTEVLTWNWAEIKEKISNGKNGIVGARLIDASGGPQEWAAGNEIGLRDIIRNNLGFPMSRKCWESQEDRKVDWVSGAALLILKTDFEVLGGFDKKMFMYFEDVDLCKRMRSIGKSVLFCSSFQVRHYGGKSSPDLQRQKNAFYLSQDYYFKKHKGPIKALILKVLRKLFN
jgi:GT2 family glycosyltransferase